MMRTRLFFLVTLFGGLSAASLGCQTQVFGGGGPGGSGGGHGDAGGGDVGGGSNCPPDALCVPPSQPVSNGIAQPAQGGYVVTLGDYPMSCPNGSPMPASCGPSSDPQLSWWNIQLNVPAAMLSDGVAHSAKELNGFFNETLPQPNAPGAPCGYGAGTLFDATFKVVAATADHLTIEVSGVNLIGGAGAVVNGTYTVPICAGANPPPQKDGPAIAMLGSQVPNQGGGNPPGSSVTVGGGPSYDPTALMIFFGNQDQSCADPFDSIGLCAAPRYQVVITLPADLQAVGSYPLQGLATMSESGSSGQPGDCWGGGGTYWDGTLEVTAIDDQFVKFTLSGTGGVTGVSGVNNADGSYTAIRCP
jgi:hypothetical protein